MSQNVVKSDFTTKTDSESFWPRVGDSVTERRSLLADYDELASTRNWERHSLDCENQLEEAFTRFSEDDLDDPRLDSCGLSIGTLGPDSQDDD